MAGPSPLPDLLVEIFADVTAGCDGGRLVTAHLSHAHVVDAFRPLRVLALGKAALPMVTGLAKALPAEALGEGLVVTTARAGTDAVLPAGFTLARGEHPRPGPASLAAGHRVRDFVAAGHPDERLIVLLSGGGSALAALPAPPLSLGEKSAATAAVAAAGASIHELNCVRKHLSALKGGRLARLARGPVLVLALSDVVGDDPATIASGPFSPDPTTFAEALAILHARGPAVPAAVFSHLEAGRRDLSAETPKAAAEFAHVDYRILAGPDQVPALATAAAQSRGCKTSVLYRNTGRDVETLAQELGAHARALDAAGAPTIGIGNGEPVIQLPAAPGLGGRATHLALLVARELRGLPGVAFLAAGTDDRDGSGDAAGAVVDGNTWERAAALGLDPAAAITRFDSAPLLEALGALVRGPGTSNLLDLHLLAASRQPPEPNR